MKRYGNLYGLVCSYDNLVLAAENAKKGKLRQKTVQEFFGNFEENIRTLQQELITHTYKTSEYSCFTIYEPKERQIYRLPFRDRVVHWAIMLIVEPIWYRHFTRDTYSCIRGRGIHAALQQLKKDLNKDPDGTTYCLKLDVKKFYPSIDHDILKKVVRQKLKDPELLAVLDEIIDSVPYEEGVPIGNYLSQFFANLYLAELDHILKERLRVKYYYRYADDLVILGPDKTELREVFTFITDYLKNERKMEVKPNYQIFPVESRGIDFVGYVTYHTHSLARKRNKKALCRKLAQLRKKGVPEEELRFKLASRLGFMIHCDSNHFLKSLNVVGMTEFKKFSRDKYKPKEDPEKPKRKKFMDGVKINVSQIFNKNIILLAWAEEPSAFEGKSDIRIKLHFEVEEFVPQPDGTARKEWVRHITFFWSENVYEILKAIDEAARQEAEQNQTDVESPYPMKVKFITQEITIAGKKGVQYSLDEPDD